jgi:mono/diheme cytochrome c family protein
MKRLARWLAAAFGLLAIVAALAVAALWWWQTADAGAAPAAVHASNPGNPAITALAPAEQLARGAYLARAGDCMACHTVRGGAAYAGGRTIRTPFGTIVTPNITPDVATGIGSWSADDFWRALHHGQGKDGRLLYPAFPYTNYTRITRADADALHAWLRSVPAARAPNAPHSLRFPYNQQWALAAWRALYFRPGVFQPESGQSVDWNRGAYLVQGLGHCSACHSPRNWLGATGATLSGGMLDGLGWYAPALDGAAAPWSQHDLAALLQTGISARTTASGPMAEVVRASLQHLNAADIGAMALYLRTVASAPAPTGAPAPRSQRGVEAQARAQAGTQAGAQAGAFLAAGARLYQQHCVECHGAGGLGQPPHYPPLAGNGALNLEQAVNPIRIVLNGGFAPATAGNPRPYGMPPFGHVLNDTEVAQLVSYVRSAWGNHAAPVTATEVNRYRAVPLDQ